jgi:hypothetical protein
VPLDVATRRDLKRLERRMAKLERGVGNVKSRVEGLEKEAQGSSTPWPRRRTSSVLRTRWRLRSSLRLLELVWRMVGVRWFSSSLSRGGDKCAAERLRVDSEYGFDIYCNAGALTAVGEAKVRAGGRDVERAFERARELLRRWPDRISGRLVPVLYALVAEPSAVQRARELKVWLIESRRELVPLDEVS